MVFSVLLISRRNEKVCLMLVYKLYNMWTTLKALDVYGLSKVSLKILLFPVNTGLYNTRKKIEWKQNAFHCLFKIKPVRKWL